MGRQETDSLYFDEDLKNEYFYHKDKNTYLRIDYNKKVHDWEDGGQEAMRYVHDNRCEYFVLEFKRINEKITCLCLFYYNTKDIDTIRREFRINFNEDRTEPEDDITAWCQKVFFQKKWEDSGRSRDNLLNCFGVHRNAEQKKKELSEANCFHPFLTNTGTDREWMRSMEQKYAQSESIKYVMGQNKEITNLILNAGRISERENDTNAEVIEHPMTFPIKNRNGHNGISHLIETAGEETLSLRPFQWKCEGEEVESGKFFYFPLTSFYQNGQRMGRIPLKDLYDDVNFPYVTRNIKRVMLRYNLSVNISFPEERKFSSVNIFYIQYTSSTVCQADDEFFNGQFRKLATYPEQDDALINDLQHNIETAEDLFRLDNDGDKSWTILRRQEYSKKSLFEELTTGEDGSNWRKFNSHGYIFPEQGKNYLQIVDQAINVVGFPICILLVKSHDDIKVKINVSNSKDISSYITF